MCFELHVLGHMGNILVPYGVCPYEWSIVWIVSQQNGKLPQSLWGCQTTIDIDCKCLVVIETFAVSELNKRKSMRVLYLSPLRRCFQNIEDAKCSWKSTSKCLLWKHQQFVKVGKCILACCQTFTLLTDFKAAEICYGLSSIHRCNVRGQSDSCWSALVLLAYWPCKSQLISTASLCAIHMHIYLQHVTCQSHSEPCATSLGPALRACSYNAFSHAAVKGCESTASPICLSGQLVTTVCIRQHTCHSHMCSVHRQVQTHWHGTAFGSRAVQKMQCR